MEGSCSSSTAVSYPYSYTIFLLLWESHCCQMRIASKLDRLWANKLHCVLVVTAGLFPYLTITELLQCLQFRHVFGPILVAYMQRELCILLTLATSSRLSLFPTSLITFIRGQNSTVILPCMLAQYWLPDKYYVFPVHFLSWAPILSVLRDCRVWQG